MKSSEQIGTIVLDELNSSFFSNARYTCGYQCKQMQHEGNLRVDDIHVLYTVRTQWHDIPPQWLLGHIT